jgi:hypothetical protein
LSHPTPGRAKDSATQEEYLLAKFLYNTIDDTYECTGETLKLREDGIKKPDAQSKVDTNLRNTVLQLACPVKHLCTSRTGVGK